MTSGPNQYTHMVALREDAVSFAFNRGLKALSENTDHLDDLVNTDRVQLTAALVSIGAPTTSIPVPADAYLGPAAHTLNAANLQQLFRVCDTDFTETVDLTSNTAVLVQSASIGTAPDPFAYAAGSETLTANVALVVGTYYLLYYRRTSFALSDRELLRHPALRAHVVVPGSLQVVLQSLRGDSLAWDASVEISLRTLARRGLAGIYASTTSIPSPDGVIAGYYTNSNTANSPGSGAFFTRAGQSMMGLSRTDLLTDSPYRDPLGAIWSSYVVDYNLGDGTGTRQFIAGSRGFVHVGRRQRATNAGSSSYAPGLASFAAYTQHGEEYSVASDAATRVDAPLACNVQRVSGNDELTITAGTNFFTKTISGTTYSALVLGATLIEVYWTNASDPVTSSATSRVYRVKEIVSDSKLRLMGQDGSAINFPASATAATILRIMSPTVVAPDGYAELQALKGNAAEAILEHGPLRVTALPAMSFALADSTVNVRGAYFGAAYFSTAFNALEWGGYEARSSEAGAYTYRREGRLRGDGSISVPNIVSTLGNIGTLTSADIINDEMVSNLVTTINLDVSGVAAVDELLADVATADILHLKRVRRTPVILDAGGSVAINLASELVDGNMAVINATSSLTITSITLPTALQLGAGAHFTIVFDQANNDAQINSGAWPSDVLFENPMDAYLSGTAGWVDVYTAESPSGVQILMSVRRYEY